MEGVVGEGVVIWGGGCFSKEEREGEYGRF